MAEENSTPDDLLEFKDDDLPPDLAYFYDAYECYGGDYENDLVSLREGLNAINAGRGLTREEGLSDFFGAMMNAINPSAKIAINGTGYPVTSLEELLPHLNRVRQAAFAEVWLRRGQEATCLLTNRERGRAFLMFLPDSSPSFKSQSAGFHATSADENLTDDDIDFLLDNGQRDTYNVRETVTLSEGLQALEHAFVAGGRATFISWQDDSL